MKSALIALIALLGAAQTGAPPPATYLSDAELMATLKETARTAPDMHTAPVQNTDHYRINVRGSRGRHRDDRRRPDPPRDKG